MNGYFGDSAYTFAIGNPDPDWLALMKNTRQALFKGIEKSLAGNRIGDVGSAIQVHAENAGYSVVREMVGHGPGKNLREEPEMPNFGRRGSGVKMTAGRVFCIEPMINIGQRNMKQDTYGWNQCKREGDP